MYKRALEAGDEDDVTSSTPAASECSAALPAPAADLEDLIPFVFPWLDAASLLRTACVRRHWRECADEPSLWKAHVLQALAGSSDGPGEPRASACR